MSTKKLFHQLFEQKKLLAKRPRNLTSFEAIDFDDLFKLHTIQLAILENMGLAPTVENLSVFEEIDLETELNFQKFDTLKLRNKLINQLVDQPIPVRAVHADDFNDWYEFDKNIFNVDTIPF